MTGVASPCGSASVAASARMPPPPSGRSAPSLRVGPPSKPPSALAHEAPAISSTSAARTGVVTGGSYPPIRPRSTDSVGGGHPANQVGEIPIGDLVGETDVNHRPRPGACRLLELLFELEDQVRGQAERLALAGRLDHEQ